VEIDYGAGGRCRIDGTVDGLIAVEIEARTSKQVRGALRDLICHSLQKKLLALLPINMDVRIEAERCRWILRRFCTEEDFQVVSLTGTGLVPKLTGDVNIISDALAKLTGAALLRRTP
jgi:hypothetical protein